MISLQLSPTDLELVSRLLTRLDGNLESWSWPEIVRVCEILNQLEER